MLDILKILLCIDSEAKTKSIGYYYIICFASNNDYIVYYVIQFNLIELVTCYALFIFVYVAIIRCNNFSKNHLYVEDRSLIWIVKTHNFCLSL